MLGSAPVAADPISDKKAQAAKIAAELRAEGDRVEQLSEQLDQARLRADTVAQKLQAAEAKMAATDAQAATVRKALADQAVNAYVSAGQPTTSLKNTKSPGCSWSIGTREVALHWAPEEWGSDRPPARHAHAVRPEQSNESGPLPP